MSIFSRLFGRSAATSTGEVSSNDGKQLPEIKKEDFVDDTDPSKDIVGKSFGTEMPIDAIYAYLERDYEQQGYEDSMCNADNSYKDSKKEIIKNGLKRLFSQVKLRYKNDLRMIEVQINIVEQQGMINTSSSLKARKETFIEHMKAIDEMETLLTKNESQMLGMIESYNRGFLKGLAAISQSYLKNQQNEHIY